MTAERLHVHTAILPIRWGDMDMLGHVNNTEYFRYMEQARIEWLDRQGAHDGYGKGKGPVIVNASCNFLVPLVYPAQVEVRMYLGSLGRSSIASYYDILANGVRYADGSAKIVWIDFATGRSTPVPEHIAAPLRAPAKGSS